MGVETASKKRCRVHPGEPGCQEVTRIVNGEPVIENPPVALAFPSSSLLPALTIEDLRGLLLSRDETAHYRLNLIHTLEGELKKNRPFDEILKDFNSGHLLEGTLAKLGHVSRRTYFRWKSAFSQGGIKSLVPETGRKNTSKITDDEIRTVLKYLLQPDRLDIAEGIYRAKEELREYGIESPSSPDILRRFINRVIKERADLWIYYREGKKAADDKVFPYLERDPRLLEVGDVIVGDGHTLNFEVINPYTGKPCRPVVVFFWDWASSFVLGWELMIQESIQCITSALRNAIICLGKKPRCVYLDNGKAFKAKVFTSDINLTDTEILGMFKRLEIEPHFALPYSARSKPIERIFRIFDGQFERLVPSYVGASIGDKPAWMKPNEKFARSMHNPHVPTIGETNNLILGWRNRYGDTPTRARDQLRPKDIFNQGKGPGVNLSELDDLMMSREIRKVHRNGITWLGRHWYNEALCGLNDKVVIRYSYSDFSQIYVYYKNEFLCVARPIQKVHPMASESENPKDMEELKRQGAEIRRIKRDVIKVCREGGPKVLERLPLKEIFYKVPDIDKDIEKIEAEKPTKFISPFIDGVTYSVESEWNERKFISPFIDELKSDAPIEKKPEGLISSSQDGETRAEEAPGSTGMPGVESKKRPKYKPPKDWSDFNGEWWEKYDYFMGQDPVTLAQEQLEFIEWYKTTSEYRAIFEAKPGRILSGG